MEFQWGFIPSYDISIQEIHLKLASEKYPPFGKDLNGLTTYLAPITDKGNLIPFYTPTRIQLPSLGTLQRSAMPKLRRGGGNEHLYKGKRWLP